MTALEEEWKARKERLLALRKRKAGEDGLAGTEDGLLLKGRNFDPQTRTLRKFDAAVIPENTIENDVKGLTEKIVLEDTERHQQELDLLNIAPKRVNWDLKREMEKKLAKLEKRTTEAIHTLIRQRIAAQRGNEEEDLVAALNAHQKDQEREQEASDEE